MAFILQPEEYNIIKGDLDVFLNNSEARTVMLCDRGGNVIADSGEEVTGAVDLVTALVAGAYAATKELAMVLGEDEFNAIFHQGDQTSIFMSSIGEEVLLLAVFSDETNAGLVKMYATTTCRKIHSLVEEVMTRSEVSTGDPTQSFVITKGNIFQLEDDS